MHFLVDALCICCLYLVTASVSFLLPVFITYNIMAFLTQPVTGAIADRISHVHWLLLLSATALSMGVLAAMFAMVSASSVAMLAGAILLGLGNSLFHVWGGKLTAIGTSNDIRALGLFVSTGAMGLAVGGVFASWTLLCVLLLAFCVLSAAFVRFTKTCSSLLVGQSGSSGGDAQCVVGRGQRFAPAMVLLLLAVIIAVVMLRSFIGATLTSGLTKTQAVILLLGFTAMMGKMAGGWLCKGMGIIPAMTLVVVVTLVCVVMPDSCLLSISGMQVSAFTLLGLFAVNCTMPVTLYFSNMLLPGREGLSFGLLAAALMPGYVLAMSSAHLLMTLIPTILIEMGVLLFLTERRGKVLLASVGINILTNVPLNIYVTARPDTTFSQLLLLELAIVVVEALCYLCVVRNIRQAIVYSLLCNAISFLTGLAVQQLYIIIV